MRRLALLALTALPLVSVSAARADGLDRDSLLTEAPATPDKGTVRVTGTGSAQQPAQGSSGSTGNSVAGTVTGTVAFTPFRHFSADVGAYYDPNGSGPSARVRYQLLNQADHGFDLATGVRMKTVGFHPGHGEVEGLVAAGRKFGQFDLVLNGVFGVETGGGQGKDIEAKGFAGYNFNEAIRAGLDGRLQAEVSDEEKPVAPVVNLAGVRDYDLTVGPAVSWMVMKNLQLQALVGVAQPKKTSQTTPVGTLSAAFDF